MERSERKNKLTITHLLAWPVGVGLAITIARGVRWLRVTAWNGIYPQSPQNFELTEYDLAVTFAYGTCLILTVFAIRSRNFWKSPGKIILMIMGLMCLIDWLLTSFASAVIIYRFIIAPTPEIASAPMVTDAQVLGIWFENFAPSIGYLFGIPLCLFILIRSKHRIHWKIVWIAFLLFSTLMVVTLFGNFSRFLILRPKYYFEIAAGFPAIAMLIALLIDLIRKNQIDWWTTVACTLLPSLWIAILWVKLFAS